MTYFFAPHLPHLGEKYFRRGKNIPKGFYRVTIKAIVINTHDEILLLKESRYGDKQSVWYRESGGMYDLPGGGLAWGEDFREGLIRELEEELGIGPDDCIIANEPLYIQVSELDDRYYRDKEKDDFYPTLMVYFPVQILLFPEGATFRNDAEIYWCQMSTFSEIQMWTHIASLAKMLKRADFPDEYISDIFIG